MRAHHEKKLKQEFVGVRKIAWISEREMPEAVLSADLAELAGPIGKNTGKAGVGEVGGRGLTAAVKPPANGPTAIQTIFRGRVHAEGVLSLESIEGGELVASAPDHLRPE